MLPNILNSQMNSVLWKTYVITNKNFDEWDKVSISNTTLLYKPDTSPPPPANNHKKKLNKSVKRRNNKRTKKSRNKKIKGVYWRIIGIKIHIIHSTIGRKCHLKKSVNSCFRTFFIKNQWASSIRPWVSWLLPRLLLFQVFILLSRL